MSENNPSYSMQKTGSRQVEIAIRPYARYGVQSDKIFNDLWSHSDSLCPTTVLKSVKILTPA